MKVLLLFGLLCLPVAAVDDPEQAMVEFTEIQVLGDQWGMDLKVNVDFPANLRISRLEDVRESTIRVTHPITEVSKSETDATIHLTLSDPIGTMNGAAALSRFWAGVLSLFAAVLLTRWGDRRSVSLALGLCSLAVVMVAIPVSGGSELRLVEVAVSDSVEFRSVHVQTASGSVVTWYVNTYPLSETVTVDGKACQKCGAESGSSPFLVPEAAFIPLVGCLDKETDMQSAEYKVLPTLDAMRDFAISRNKAYYAVTGTSGKIAHGFVLSGFVQLSKGNCMAYGNQALKNQANSASWALYAAVSRPTPAPVNNQASKLCPAAGGEDELCLALSGDSGCEYKATSNGKDCNAYCAAKRLTCLDSWDDAGWTCTRAGRDSGTFRCAQPRSKQICRCSLPTTTAPPTTPATREPTSSAPPPTAPSPGAGVDLGCAPLTTIKSTAGQYAKPAMGPMVGAISASTAILWAWHPDKDTAIKYWPKTNPAGSKTVNMVRDAGSYSSRVKLAGLTFSTEYSYQLLAGGAALGPAGSFKTAPQPYTKTKFKYFTGSCARVQLHKNQIVWDHALTEQPDLAVFGGDNIYLDGTDYDYLGNVKRHAEQRSIIPKYAEFLRNTPTVATWDDHDFGENNSGSENKHKKCNREAFSHFWANEVYGEGGEGIYSRMVYGQVEFFLMDGRYWQVDNKSYMGPKQMAWLKTALKDSQTKGAIFKVIVHGGTVRRGGPESWFETAPEEGKELLSFLKTNSITGVILHGGDVHKNWVNPYPRCPRSSAPHYDLYEIVNSGLTYEDSYHTTVEVDTFANPPKLVYNFWAKRASQSAWEKYETGTFTLENNKMMKHTVNQRTGRSTTFDDCQAPLKESFAFPQ